MRFGAQSKRARVNNFGRVCSVLFRRCVDKMSLSRIEKRYKDGCEQFWWTARLNFSTAQRKIASTRYFSFYFDDVAILKSSFSWYEKYAESCCDLDIRKIFAKERRFLLTNLHF